MTTRELPWTETGAGDQRLRRLAAASLRITSVALGRLARRLGRQGRIPDRTAPVFEFYAEAGAPEGALYIDGRLVGHINGVSRL